MFNTKNSARKIVVDSPNWKSRKFDLGNRHLTTLNFGDLVPAYWSHVQPGDKLKIDDTILCKFMPLIAPAFSRMTVKSEWFYVPLRQISPSSIQALQDFDGLSTSATNEFNKLLLNGSYTSPFVRGKNQQSERYSGFPSVPAFYLSAYLCSSTITFFDRPGASTFLNSQTVCSFWRSKNTLISNINEFNDNIGYEDLGGYNIKFRVAKCLSYMGLPQRLSTLRFTGDAAESFHSGFVGQIPDGVFRDNLDNYSSSSSQDSNFDFYYRGLTFRNISGGNSAVVFAYENGKHSAPVNYANSGWENILAFNQVGMVNGNSFDILSDYDAQSSDLKLPLLTTYDTSLISLLPFMSYQKIYNDFYRDEKLNQDEIRLYPNAAWSPNSHLLCDSLTGKSILDVGYVNWIEPYIGSKSPHTGIDGLDGLEKTSLTRLINNLCCLRRRSRSKDALSSCITDKVLVNRTGNISAPNVFQSNLFSKFEKFIMKKEFTGSTWAEWLNSFFGVNSNDLLNNNVVFLGSHSSTVSIAENIQQSSSTDDSPQGNRAGLAADFHSGDEIYFRVPDFGIIMCVVSVIPDDLDNFNGLFEKFQKSSFFDFNLPDFQNIGFAPVFNKRSNLGVYDITDNRLKSSINLHYDNNGVFGYQPFGYQHTYNPNVISGDMRKSLRYWHQSPDLDRDFTGDYVTFEDIWADNQPKLNANYSSIGLRLQPSGKSFKSQYYNNIFAVTADDSGDHIVADMRFFVTCHRNSAFFTDAIEDEQ